MPPTSASGRTTIFPTPPRVASITSSTNSFTTLSTSTLPVICKNIHVTILPDGGLSVGDDGRGIPVEEHPTEKKSNLEVVMTIVGAGGKFDNKAYKSSAGLHGMGAKAVTALSETTIAEVRRNGQLYKMEFERGYVSKPLEVMGPATHTGTKISFWPDSEIFGATQFEYDALENAHARTGVPQSGPGHHSER